MSLFPELPFQPGSIPQERWHELGDCVNALFALAPLSPGELKRPRYPDAMPESLPEGAPRIIGIAGKPRCGKDVVADYLEAHYLDVRRVNFSDPILREVNRWLEPSGHQITQGNKSQSVYRSLLQAWGMARREEDQQYWTGQLAETIKQMQKSGVELVVVCGVRAVSDLEMVERLGGQCWQVERPGNDYQATHQIETGLEGINPDRLPRILNPTEGDLRPYEANIRAVLSSS